MSVLNYLWKRHFFVSVVHIYHIFYDVIEYFYLKICEPSIRPVDKVIQQKYFHIQSEFHIAEYSTLLKSWITNG